MIAVVLAFAAALAQTASAHVQTGGQAEVAATANAGPEAPASAASDAAPTAAPTPTGPVRERLICTNQQVTGSRFPIRRCRTVAQIAADRVESQEMLRRQQGARVPPAG